MINPANGNTKPMFVGQGDQIFMNEVFLKYLTAPTITSGGNPPAFSLTPDGRLTAKNADISGNVNANSGRSTTSRLTRTAGFWENCPRTRLKAISLKQWAKLSPGLPCTGTVAIRTITVRIYDDQPFDRQIVIPAVAFSGAKHERAY